MNGKWRCDICNRLRVDKKIAVHSIDISSRYDLPHGMAVMNVKYCNDNAICEAKARNKANEDATMSGVTDAKTEKTTEDPVS